MALYRPRVPLAPGATDWRVDPAVAGGGLFVDIQTAVDHLNGVGRCPSTGESAARTTWVTDQILASYYTAT